MIGPVHGSVQISTDSPEVFPLELSFSVRPTGRLDLLGQVPTLGPFRALPLGTRLWLRWAQPEEAGLEEGHLEVGVASDRDAPAHTAQVIARAEVTDHWGSWALFRVRKSRGRLICCSRALTPRYGRRRRTSTSWPLSTLAPRTAAPSPLLSRLRLRSRRNFPSSRPRQSVASWPQLRLRPREPTASRGRGGSPEGPERSAGAAQRLDAP